MRSCQRPFEVDPDLQIDIQLGQIGEVRRARNASIVDHNIELAIGRGGVRYHRPCPGPVRHAGAIDDRPAALCDNFTCHLPGRIFIPWQTIKPATKIIDHQRRPGLGQCQGIATPQSAPGSGDQC